MKKILKLSGAILLSVLLFSSCGGPSACECLNEYNAFYIKSPGGIDKNLIERCMKKYGKDFEHLKGTIEYSDRMRSTLSEKCKN